MEKIRIEKKVVGCNCEDCEKELTSGYFFQTEKGEDAILGFYCQDCAEYEFQAQFLTEEIRSEIEAYGLTSRESIWRQINSSVDAEFKRSGFVIDYDDVSDRLEAPAVKYYWVG